jgi:hypothetical protein
MAWWEGDVVCGSVSQRYEERGGGQIDSVSWAKRQPPPAEVDALDGQLLILSPWAVREVRFDETLLGYGFDVDFSLRVRQSGRALQVIELRVVHHRELELIRDLAVWVEAHIRLAEKWDGELNGPVDGEAGWKRRARLAEARRESARAIAMSEALRLSARVLELERELEAKTSAPGWRATAPLRTLNHLRREVAQRRNGAGRRSTNGG